MRLSHLETGGSAKENLLVPLNRMTQENISLKENDAKENEASASLLFQNRNPEPRAPNRNIYPEGEQKPISLLAVFFAFNQLSEISFRFRRALILAVLIALLDNVQNPLDGTAGSRVLANFELAG